MKEVAKKIPAFFKVFIPETSSQKMEIPLAFGVHMKGKLPEKGHLRDIKDDIWLVEVKKYGDSWFFEDGWAEFVKANGVEEGDFLVFQFDGKYIFDFKLLGKAACEKLNREAFDIKKKAKKVVEEEQEKNIRREEQLDVAEHIGNDDDVVVVEEEEHSEDEDYTEEEENDSDNADGSDDDDYEMEDEEEEEIRVRKGKKIRRSEEANNSCAGLIEYGHRTNNSEGKAIAKVYCNECKRAEVPIEMEDDDDLNIFKSGRVVPPNNPFFVAKIRKLSRRNELYVPIDLIKDYNIELPKEITLCDLNGRQWKAHVCIWKDGRTWLTRGWRRFCKWHNVKEEDRCVCEFIRVRGQIGTFLQVHILRAGSW